MQRSYISSPHVAERLALLLLDASRDGAQFVPGLIRRRYRPRFGWLGAAARIGGGNMGRADSLLRTSRAITAITRITVLPLLSTTVVAVLPPTDNLTALHHPVESGLVGLALVRNPELAATTGLDGLGGQEGYLGG